MIWYSHSKRIPGRISSWNASNVPIKIFGIILGLKESAFWGILLQRLRSSEAARRLICSLRNVGLPTTESASCTCARGISGAGAGLWNLFAFQLRGLLCLRLRRSISWSMSRGSSPWSQALESRIRFQCLVLGVVHMNQTKLVSLLLRNQATWVCHILRLGILCQWAESLI